MKHRPLAIGALAAVYLSMSSPAYAYLDGATGSMLLQAAIGGIATAMVWGRLYVAKAKALLTGGLSRPRSGGDPE